MYEKTKLYLSGIGKSIIYGLSFMFIKNSLKHISIFSLLSIRFTLAAITMIAMYFLNIIEINYKGKDVLNLIKLSLLYPVVYFIFETIGLKYASSTQAGIMMALIPVVVAIFSTILLKERPNKVEAGFIIMSISGILFITLMSGNSGKCSLVGLLSLIISIVCAALYNVMSRKLSNQFSPTEITFNMMCVGAIVFDVIFVIEKLIKKDFSQFLKEISNTSVILSIIYLGILASIVASFLNNYMLSKSTASQTSIYANLTTVITILAGVIFLNEDFCWYELLGSILIIAGVWGTNHYGLNKS